MLNDHIIARLIKRYQERVRNLSKDRTDIRVFNRLFDNLKEHEQIDIFNELFKFQGIRILEDMDDLEPVIHLPGLGRFVLKKNTKDRLDLLAELDYMPDSEEIRNICKDIYWKNLKDRLENKRIRQLRDGASKEFSREELTNKR